MPATSNQNNHKPPLRYDASYEHLEADEQQVEDKLIDTMLGMSRKTHADSGHAMRSVHVKSHAIVRGELQVLDNLPPELAQGLFAAAATYPLVMRFSTTPGDILPDSVSTPRGLAIKVIGVPGDRLPGSESDTTQDFVVVNGPAFQVKNAKAFLTTLKPLAALTDKATGFKEVVSATLRGVESAIEAVGSDSPKIKNMGGEPPHHPLGETYFTQVPVLYGNYFGKICVAPVSPELTALTGHKIDITEQENALRDALSDHFAQQGGTWEIRIQLCTDVDKMPIEDASVIWPEKESPYIAVGRIIVSPQPSWIDDTTPDVQDRLSFSPWHGLAAHRPLGSIMRIRKKAYEQSVRFRSQHNGKAIIEPRSLEDVFGSNNLA